MYVCFVFCNFDVLCGVSVISVFLLFRHDFNHFCVLFAEAQKLLEHFLSGDGKRFEH